MPIKWRRSRALFGIARGATYPSKFPATEDSRQPHHQLAFATQYARRKRMLRFTKMNGAGNDFVLIDNRAGDIHLNRSQIACLCDRHRGNGARCFARFANKVAGAQGTISFETPAGVIGAELTHDLVTLQMTEPTDLRLNVTVRDVNENKTVHFINSGVPHVVVPVSQIDDVDVQRQGAAIRHHEMFSPNGANVNFIEKRDTKQIAVRTYERGVESETLACGTGVVASALIFAALEKIDGPIGILVRGGNELQVGFEQMGTQFKNVTLTGPTDFVFEGTIEL